jgi:ankyrin repeat protein
VAFEKEHMCGACDCAKTRKQFVMRITEQLVEAVCTGDSKFILEALLQGANPNACYRGRPLLIWAIQEKRLNIVKALVRAGASLEKKDDQGFTPLHQAVGEGDVKIVRFLLKSGISVNRRSKHGTPLHTACSYKRLEIAKLLLAHGANVCTLDDEGNTPADLTRRRANATDKAIQKLLAESKASS